MDEEQYRDLCVGRTLDGDDELWDDGQHLVRPRVQHVIHALTTQHTQQT